MSETWPAGELGASVSADVFNGFVEDPSKKAPQYRRLPSRSDREEHALVLFELCAMNDPIEEGITPRPPFNVVPDNIAMNDERLNEAL